MTRQRLLAELASARRRIAEFEAREGFVSRANSSVENLSAMLHDIFNALSDNIALLDSDGTILFVNNAWREFAAANGARVQDVSEGANYLRVCDHCAEHGHREADRENAREMAEHIRGVLDGSEEYSSMEYECSFLAMTRWFLARIIRVMAGPDIHVLVLHENITERKLSEISLWQGREQLRLLTEHAPVALALLDLDMRYLVASRRWLEDFGLAGKDITGLSHYGLFPEIPDRWKEIHRRCLAGAVERAEEDPFVRADGRTQWLRWEVRPWYIATDVVGGLVIFSEDITERKKIQDVLIQNEKMIGIGKLAAGIAHEINNPLSGILQSSQVLLKRLSPDTPASLDSARQTGCEMAQILDFMARREIPALLSGIRDSALRASRIVSTMLDFSRKGESAKQPTDLNVLFDTALHIYSTHYDLKKKYDFRRFEIVRDYDPRLPQVVCSPTQIEQVIMNILGNAAQALADRENPRITLRTRLLDGMVMFQVEDNGPGMDETTRRRAFEPFFTTKKAGEGTGLGLSVSYSIIVNNHGGSLGLDSKPGAGTVFTIRLPLEEPPLPPARENNPG